MLLISGTLLSTKKKKNTNQYFRTELNLLVFEKPNLMLGNSLPSCSAAIRIEKVGKLN